MAEPHVLSHEVSVFTYILVGDYKLYNNLILKKFQKNKKRMAIYIYIYVYMYVCMYKGKF